MAAYSGRAVNELNAVLSEEKRNEIMTLKIISCDCVGGKAFNAASVVTQEMLSTFPDFPTEKSCTLAFEDVWDMRKLRALVELNTIDDDKEEEEEEGVRTKKRKICRLGPNNEEQEAFQNLDKYVLDFDYHMNCMKKVLGNKKEAKELSEAEVVKVLNVHLFNPLSGEKCLIDTHITKEDNCICSCGCGTPIEKGPTGIGVESCWHGFVDMVVRCSQQVNVLQTTDPPEEIKMAVKVTKDEHLFDLTSLQSSVIAETITNSFAQVNTNPSLSGLPIPAFGCTPDKILVFAYDSTNDMLLKKMVDMKLLHEDVNTATVVMVWLYINFTSFMRRDVTDTVTKPYLLEFTAEFFSSRSIVSCYKKSSCGIAEFHPASNWPKLNFYSSANMT